jgi:hypothetical protein
MALRLLVEVVSRRLSEAQDRDGPQYMYAGGMDDLLSAP